jgi:5-methylcytosine-specific restriction enzyme subunit McrC
MIRRTVHEWGYLPITADGASRTLTRSQSNRLLYAARAAQVSLRLGGSDANKILVDHGRRLRAQQVVGVLTAPGISLEILPKIDGLEEGSTRVNLIRMLARTLDLKIAVRF